MVKKRREMSGQQTKKKFESLIQRFTSLERVADALRSHPGFEKTNRATVHRWRTSPSRRTELAIQLLSFEEMPSRLRIAEPRSVLVLPSLMLGWKAEEGKPYGRMEELFGIEIETESVGTGGEALELLQAAEVDVALAAPTLALKYSDCHRICSLTESPTLGIANRPVTGVNDLKGLRCGCFANSVTPYQLNELNLNWKLDLPPVLRFDSVAECIKAFNNVEIDCFVAWQPFISQIRTAVPDLHPVKDTVFDTLEIHVMVNSNTNKHPKAVRAYLECLQEAIIYIDRRRNSDGFYNEIAAQLTNNDVSLSKQDIRDVLENTLFSMENCQLSTLLMLWKRSDMLSISE